MPEAEIAALAQRSPSVAIELLESFHSAACRYPEEAAALLSISDTIRAHLGLPPVLVGRKYALHT